MNWKSIIYAIGIVTLVVYAFITIFGLQLSDSKKMHMDAFNCPAAMGCQNSIQHISHWQDAFTVTYSQAYLFALLLSVLLVFVLVTKGLLSILFDKRYLRALLSKKPPKTQFVLYIVQPTL